MNRRVERFIVAFCATAFLSGLATMIVLAFAFTFVRLGPIFAFLALALVIAVIAGLCHAFDDKGSGHG